MDQRNDRKPNPAARPEQEQRNESPIGGGPDASKADPTGRAASTGGAFGKEGHSNRTRGVDSTGAGVAANDRNELDDDTPRTAVGNPHLTRAHPKQ